MRIVLHNLFVNYYNYLYKCLSVHLSWSFSKGPFTNRILLNAGQLSKWRQYKILTCCAMHGYTFIFVITMMTILIITY